MKQVLSVADFATLLNLVDDKLYELRTNAIMSSGYVGDSDKVTKQKQEEALKQLERIPLYQTLSHLKESLQNLNVEVECPDVEIKRCEEDSRD